MSSTPLSSTASSSKSSSFAMVPSMPSSSVHSGPIADHRPFLSRPQSSQLIVGPRPQLDQRIVGPRPQSDQRLVPQPDQRIVGPRPQQIAGPRPVSPHPDRRIAPRPDQQLVSPRPQPDQRIARSDQRLVSPRPQLDQQIAGPRPQPDQRLVSPRPQLDQRTVAPRPQSDQRLVSPRPQSVSPRPDQRIVAPRPRPDQRVASPRPHHQHDQRITGRQLDQWTAQPDAGPDALLPAEIRRAGLVIQRRRSTTIQPIVTAHAHWRQQLAELRRLLDENQCPEAKDLLEDLIVQARENWRRPDWRGNLAAAQFGGLFSFLGTQPVSVGNFVRNRLPDGAYEQAFQLRTYGRLWSLYPLIAACDIRYNRFSVDTARAFHQFLTNNPMERAFWVNIVIE